MIPNALGGKLATSDRREKEEIPVKFSSSPLLPTSTLLTLPQLAPIYSLSRALVLKRELHSLFLGGGGFRLRIFGVPDGAAEPPGEVLSAGEEGGRWSGRASGPASAGQPRSVASGPGS